MTLLLPRKRPIIVLNSWSRSCRFLQGDKNNNHVVFFKAIKTIKHVSISPFRKNLIIPEAIALRSCHFLQGDMKFAVPGAPKFGIGQIPFKSNEGVQSIPNIWVTVKGRGTDQHIAFQKKA
jgi:hypothetical protein